MTEALLGFMTAAWLFTVGGGVYAVWRYVWTPWKVVRADQAAMHGRITQLEQERELRKVMTLMPEEEYKAEVRERTRRLAREHAL